MKMSAFTITILLACSVGGSESFGSEVKRLELRLDFFLDSVINIKQDLQHLQEEFGNFKQQFDPAVCSVYQCILSQGTSKDSTERLADSFEAVVGEVQSNVQRLQKGLQDEKMELRNMLDEHDNKTKALKGDLSQFEENLSIIHKTVEDDRKYMTDEINLLSDAVHRIEADVSRVSREIPNVSHLERQIMTRIVKLLGRQDVVMYGTSLYRYYPDKLTWSEAQQKCQKEGFHLAEVSDKEELDVVRKLDKGEYAWLGSTDVETEGVWRWATSGLDVLESLWCKGQPDNSGGKEHCAMDFGSRGKCLNDNPCSPKMAFVCEIELQSW